jgi:peroxiredoxin
MAATPPICDFGWKPPAFSLPSTDGKLVTLDDVKGEKGTMVAFICNHCPYVLSIVDRLVATANDMAKLGIGFVAICSNDADAYPDDSFDNMIEFAKQNNFTFPYLHDESQEVAKAWDAICTPDFFGFNAKNELQYRGRLDASRKDPVPGARRDLFEAMSEVARTGKGPQEQISSMGCSIKWKTA